MPPSDKKPRRLDPILRALVETGFIIFLFYSNLLMGEFNRASGQNKTLLFALKDIFTAANFVVAVISGLLGYLIFEYLRKRI